MRTGLRIVATALVAAGVLAACTSTPDPGGDTATSTVDPTDSAESIPESTVETTAEATGAAAWCALAPPSLVVSTLGIELHDPSASFTSEEIRCTYVPVLEGELTIRVRFRLNQDHATFAAYRDSIERPDEPMLDLPNVGDEAFYRTNEFDIQITHILVARQGSVAVQLEAPGTLVGCTDLVRAILAQLT